MRIALSAGRWPWPWNRSCWKGWLYLTILVFVSGRLLVGQGFSLTLTTTSMEKNEPTAGDNKHDRGLKMAITTWSTSSPLGSSPKVTHNPNVSQLDANEDATTRLPYNEQVVEEQQTESGDKTEEERVGDVAQKEHRYWLRSERIKQVCRNWGVVSNPPVFATNKNDTRPVRSPPVSPAVESPATSHFSLAPSFRSMGCFLNKVASSSLVSAFLLVHGLGPTFTSPHSLTFHLLPRSLEDFQFANSTFFKFMFVRHPMDRMLSCYLDKMIESPHFSLPPFRNYVRNTARDVMAKRKKAHQLEQKQMLTSRKLLSIENSLKQQVEIIYGRRMDGGNDTTNSKMEETETMKLHRYLVQQLKRPGPIRPTQRPVITPLTKNNYTGVKPTFEEFLEFVLDTDLLGYGYDSHWVPFHRYCTPCSVPYHVIGKLETAAEDFQYIWDKTGLGTKVPVPWINRTAAPSKSKIALEKKYYASLPRDLILRFYEKFRMDFEMFDYSINDILLKAGYETIKE